MRIGACLALVRIPNPSEMFSGRDPRLTSPFRPSGLDLLFTVTDRISSGSKASSDGSCSPATQAPVNGPHAIRIRMLPHLPMQRNAAARRKRLTFMDKGFLSEKHQAEMLPQP